MSREPISDPFENGGLEFASSKSWGVSMTCGSWSLLAPCTLVHGSLLFATFYFPDAEKRVFMNIHVYNHGSFFELSFVVQGLALRATRKNLMSACMAKIPMYRIGSMFASIPFIS